MKGVTQEQKQIVIDLISRSFDKDAGLNYLIPQDNRRNERIRSLVAYCLEVATRTGEVYLSDNDKSAALLIHPEKQLKWATTARLDTKLIWNAIGFGNIVKALTREAKLKLRRQKHNVSYLWFIGVDPAYQGQGIGQAFLHELVLNERQKNRNLILECSPENLNWYKKNGFKIYNELAEPPFQYFMEYAG